MTQFVKKIYFITISYYLELALSAIFYFAPWLAQLI